MTTDIGNYVMLMGMGMDIDGNEASHENTIGRLFGFASTSIGVY